MTKNHEAEALAKEISRLLFQLEGYFWDVHIEPGYEAGETNRYYRDELEDKETWLFHGTRQLYYKICLFLELKNVPRYLDSFSSKFSGYIDKREEVLKSRAPLYSESDPSMIILDDFRNFISGFSEFDSTSTRNEENSRVRLILENTHSVIERTHTTIKNETSLNVIMRWLIGIIYPRTRALNKARFIRPFKTYHPDILIPEIYAAVEYKYLRRGGVVQDYLDQIKTDADNYVGDPEYKFFYAIVYFEERGDLNNEAFKNAVSEKDFPENWVIIAT